MVAPDLRTDGEGLATYRGLLFSTSQVRIRHSESLVAAAAGVWRRSVGTDVIFLVVLMRVRCLPLATLTYSLPPPPPRRGPLPARRSPAAPSDEQLPPCRRRSPILSPASPLPALVR